MLCPCLDPLLQCYSMSPLQDQVATVRQCTKLATTTWLLWKLLPGSIWPRTPCDKFVYDFPCDFWGIVGGYGLRHMCSHCLWASCIFFYGASGATQGKSVQRLCRDCMEIVQCQCSCRGVSAASARKSYTEPVRGSAFARCPAPCGDCAMPPTTCLWAMGLRFFSNLYNFSLNQIVEAAEPVQKSHSRLLPPHGGLAEAAWKGGYGQDTGSVDLSLAKCELGICDEGMGIGRLWANKALEGQTIVHKTMTCPSNALSAQSLPTPLREGISVRAIPSKKAKFVMLWPWYYL